MFIKILFTTVLWILTNQSIYKRYYEQALQIVGGMSLDQKIGQTLQVDVTAFMNDKGVTDEQVAIRLMLGSILVGGDGTPDQNGNMINIPNKEPIDRKIYSQSYMSKWQKLSSKFNYSVSVTTKNGKRYEIRPLLATDAVHGNQHVSGTILFPQGAGLACSHNAENFYNAGYWTGVGVKQSGFNLALAPTVSVSHNPQWGRFYETKGQEQDYIYEYAKRFTEGLQGSFGNLTGVVGSAKHFFGDGATLYGTDEGNSIVSSFKSFVKHNTAGYKGAIAAQIGTVMVSQSAINWVSVAISPSVNIILKQQLGFDGIVITDYDEVQRIITQTIPTNLNLITKYWDSVTTLINAGIDMFMIPGWRGVLAANDVVVGMKQGIKNGTIAMERLNDAVARILSVKLAIGIANLVKSSELTSEQHKTQHFIPHLTTEYEDSLTAVHESLVLLKNNGVLPVAASQLEYIVLVGQRIIDINQVPNNIELFRDYDNIGMQNGGWTLRWQGFQGNSQWQGENKMKTKATSILDALKNLGQKFMLVYPNYTNLTDKGKIDLERNNYLSQLKNIRRKMTAKNTLILGVVGETTYAEFKGDVGVPYCVNQTFFDKAGCLYDYFGHAYLPVAERETLDLDYQQFDKDVIASIREQDKNIPLLTVILAGRPMLIDNILGTSTAVLDAWLPGTSGGEGIIDAVIGRYRLRPNGGNDRRNTLAFDWPRNAESVKNFPIYGGDGTVPRVEDPLFTVGYGLSTSVKQEPSSVILSDQ